MKRMKRANVLFGSILGIAAFALAVLFSSCQSSAHPNVKTAVYRMLDDNSLSDIVIAEDRDSGVITLNGVVNSPDQKTKAVTVVSQAAPGYTIANQLQVEHAGIVGVVQPGGDYASAKMNDTLFRMSTTL
jgi:hypothetical protein